MNLIGNALKYTSQGYVHVTLAASEIEKGHRLGTARKVDGDIDGSGYWQRDLERVLIFKTIHAVHAGESPLQRNRLSLSIVRSIVGLLEGEIAIYSEVRRGTGRLLTDSHP